MQKETTKNLFTIAKEEQEKSLKLKRDYYSIKADELLSLMKQATINADELFNALTTAFYYGKAQGKKEEKSKLRKKGKDK